MGIPNMRGVHSDTSQVNVYLDNKNKSAESNPWVLGGSLLLGGILSGLVEAGSVKASQQTQQTQQTQQIQQTQQTQQTPEQAIENQKNQVKVMENYINALNETIEDLTAKTD